MDIKNYIRTIPDFPKEGIMFRDVTTVMQSAEGFKLAIDMLSKALEGVDFDVIAGIESRGFLFGAPLAYNLGKPFVLIRKKGKLPFETISQEYALEYGSAEVEIHTDSIKAGDRVVIVDDLIATGGSMKAAIKLVERLSGKVEKLLFLIELTDLKGREALEGYEVYSACQFEGE
jgi:adenine phosphoribosyltransferase